MSQRLEPTLDDLDFRHCAMTCAQAAMAKTGALLANKGQQSWQYRDGFAAYSDGMSLHDGMSACAMAESRFLWRMGWMTAMFLDLHSREQIHCVSKEG